MTACFAGGMYRQGLASSVQRIGTVLTSASRRRLYQSKVGDVEANGGFRLVKEGDSRYRRSRSPKPGPLPAETRNAKDFYRYYLNLKLRRDDTAGFSEICCPRPLAALDQNTVLHLSGNPLAPLSDSKISVGTALQCLESFTLQNIPVLEKRQQTRLTYVDGQPGTRALLWFLNSDWHQHAEALDKCALFLRSMTFCMVAEHSDDETEHFLLSEWKSKSGTTFHDATIRVLRGGVARAFIEAQVFWASKAAVFDDALTSLSRLKDFTFARKRRTGADITWNGTGDWIARAMRLDGLNAPTDTVLFEKFIADRAGFRSDSMETQFNWRI